MSLKEGFLSLNAKPDFKQPYIHEWTFGIQTELTPDIALEVRYLGLSAIQMSHFHFFGNQAVPGPGPIQPRRLYPDFNFLIDTGSGASANYNSLQVQLTKRMSQGLSFMTSYTWAKSITNNEGEEGGYASGDLAQNDNNRAEERARGVNDARQRLVLKPGWSHERAGRWLGAERDSHFPNRLSFYPRGWLRRGQRWHRFYSARPYL
ncbi:MAG: hypothetical protein DMG05_23005 [Acidobacteria bacterium]|nr:MAG: hypothetical protein DMG05_23005 [Acidobacteriota bacterium]